MKNNEQVKIEIESPIFSRVLKGADLIKPCLSFSAEWFQKTQFRTIRKEYTKHLIKKGGIIYTGWIERIRNYCSRNNLSLSLEVADLMVALDNEVVPNLKAKLPAVEGFVELRPEQMRQVSAAIEKRRGYIVAPMGCLTGDTLININRCEAGGVRELSKLYKRFNQMDRSNYNFDLRFETFVRSYKEDEGLIKLHKISNVVHSGMNPVFKMTLENGLWIKATRFHLFMTDEGWIPLYRLLNKNVMIDTLKPESTVPKRTWKDKPPDPLVGGLIYHPYAQFTQDGSGWDMRIEKHRVIFEANLNNLSVEEYRRILKNDPRGSRKLYFVNPKEFHIHHKDHNHSNNEISNLECMDSVIHNKLHADYKYFSQGIPKYSKCISIDYTGKENTYDIICEDPYHNFVANGMVVHNSGKTIEFMAILKAFEKYNCLVSVPGISILSKTIQDLKKFQFKNVNQLGEGQRTVKKGISVATMQTLRTLDLINLSGFWDVFIGDELHLAVKEASTYEKILSQLLCPIRLGFTATFPKNEERALIAEGIIGPIIDQISFEESESLGITMKPKIEFITIPFDKKINELRKFPEIYKEGIVTNTIRSRRIIAKAKELIEKRGKTVLIFSSERNLEHGQILLEMAIKSGLGAEYVRGETKGIEREKILKRIEKKELKIVIATRVWREGINIRSLGGMINAKGGKAEEGTGGDEGLLQGIGRLLRTCEGLDEVVYADCLDPYRYLSDHTVSRIALYVEMDWM